jgi:hypothetical protein
MGSSPDAVLVVGLESGIDWFELDSNGLLDRNNTRLRMPAGEGGNWYRLVPQQTQPPYFVVKNGTTQVMRITTPFLNVTFAPPAIDAIDSYGTAASMELQLGNEVAPFTEPIALPTGMVIDLKWSSASAQALATSLEATGALGKIDLMFTPRGNITGPASVMGPIHFLIHDLQDAVARDPNNSALPLSPISPKNRSDKIILTIFPATGNVQSFPIDSTDVLNNSDGSAGPDGLADDLFRFARNGSGT